MKNTIILSIAFNFHDSNISLSIGDEIVASLELERLFRSKKLCASLTQMEIATNYLLSCYSLTINDVDYLIVNSLNHPFDMKNNPDDINININKVVFLGQKLPAIFVRHHFAHAGYYLLSGFSSALIATCDGGGDLGERVAYFIGQENDIKRIEGDYNCHTSTKPYGQISAFLFQEPFCEGKLMGLAAFGKKDPSIQNKVDEIFPKLKNVTFREGQEISSLYFDKFRGVAKKDPIAAADIAYCLHNTFVNVRRKNIEDLYQKQFQNIVIVGGAALNLDSNTEIYKNISSNVFIPPSCDDTGIAVGQNAIAISKIIGKKPKCSLPYLSLSEDQRELNRLSTINRDCIINDPLEAAKRLYNNEVCLAHIGRAEIGPRALGHRSFLLNPIDEINRDIISVEIKKREWYRPIAPIVIDSELHKWFKGGPGHSEYMLFSYENKDHDIKSIIHKDNSSRVQTISACNEPFLYELLSEFKRLSGVGMLINTSLNLKNEPLSNSLWETLNIKRKIHRPSFILTNSN